MADERDKGPTIPHSTDEENSAIDKTPGERAGNVRIDERKGEEHAGYRGNQPNPERGEIPRRG